jgi:hypothetical protein
MLENAAAPAPAAAGEPQVNPAEQPAKTSARCFLRPRILNLVTKQFKEHEIEMPVDFFYPSATAPASYAWSEIGDLHVSFMNPRKISALAAATAIRIKIRDGVRTWYVCHDHGNAARPVIPVIALSADLPEEAVPEALKIFTADRPSGVVQGPTEALMKICKAPKALTAAADIREALAAVKPQGPVIWATLKDLAGETLSKQYYFEGRWSGDHHAKLLPITTHAHVTRHGTILAFDAHDPNAMKAAGFLTKDEHEARIKLAWVARKKATGAWEARPKPKPGFARSFLPDILQVTRLDGMPIDEPEAAALAALIGPGTKGLPPRTADVRRFAVTTDATKTFATPRRIGCWEFEVLPPLPPRAPAAAPAEQGAAPV